MKRLTQYDLEINGVIVDIDAMLSQLTVLEHEVITKLGSYTVNTKSYMLENYDNCDETSLTIIPEVMDTFKQLFDEFRVTLFRIRHNYYSKYEKDIAIEEIHTIISKLLTNLQIFDNSLRIITDIKYQDYIERQDEDYPSLWGGRRSKGWRRKTKRRRNNKTKRRRNKSMRLH